MDVVSYYFFNNGVFCQRWQNSLVSSVHGGKILWCLLSTVAKNVVSFVHPGKNSLVSFGSGVFCPTFLYLMVKGKKEMTSVKDAARCIC